ncbi:hypothetical protein EVAR_12207_1 [Eumeta japonica]|uniref:Uncharacterized protein n=1 Tax=Eumeta variegata TaxID=151549 RepID=A0A4C1UI01_EUMVA|nr:hypothetical protein EVAR_12207_1 [Eumeta japonica]
MGSRGEGIRRLGLPVRRVASKISDTPFTSPGTKVETRPVFDVYAELLAVCNRIPLAPEGRASFQTGGIRRLLFHCREQKTHGIHREGFTSPYSQDRLPQSFYFALRGGRVLSPACCYKASLGPPEIAVANAIATSATGSLKSSPRYGARGSL